MSAAGRELILQKLSSTNNNNSDAELLGIQDRIGTLESGKLADIVAIPGDPIQDIRQAEKVFFVMMEGAIYRDDHERR